MPTSFVSKGAIGGGAAPFDPTDYGNPVEWLKIDDLTGYADEDSLTSDTWTAAIGGNLSMSGGTYKANEINGYAAAGDMSGTFTEITMASAYSVFGVVKVSADGCLTGHSSNRQFRYWYSSSESLYVYDGTGGGGSGAVDLSTWVLLEYLYDGTNITFYVNGVYAGTVAGNSTMKIDGVPGFFGSSGSLFSELLVFDDFLVKADRWAVEDYFNDKYDIWPVVDPDSISGIEVWYDANQLTGLSDTDPVATWDDFSGNGNDATQATSGERPTYQTNELNGKPAVLFDGTDDGMDITTPITPGNNWTVFSVIKKAASGDKIMTLDNGTSYLSASVFWSDNNIYTENSSNYIVTSSADAATSWAIWSSASISSSSLALYKNGTAVAMSGALSLPTTTTWDALGWRGAEPSYSKGLIAEIIAFDTTLSKLNRNKVDFYSNRKYNIY